MAAMATTERVILTILRWGSCGGDGIGGEKVEEKECVGEEFFSRKVPSFYTCDQTLLAIAMSRGSLTLLVRSVDANNNIFFAELTSCRVNAPTGPKQIHLVTHATHIPMRLFFLHASSFFSWLSNSLSAPGTFLFPFSYAPFLPTYTVLSSFLNILLSAPGE